MLKLKQLALICFVSIFAAQMQATSWENIKTYLTVANAAGTAVSGTALWMLVREPKQENPTYLDKATTVSNSLLKLVKDNTDKVCAAAAIGLVTTGLIQRKNPLNLTPAAIAYLLQKWWPAVILDTSNLR